MALYGKFLGVPYDFRRPTWRKLKSHYWNPDDERIFIERAFGIGWDINLYSFRKRYPALFYISVALTVAVQIMRIVNIRRKVVEKNGQEG
jgi:uncharacterized membrane protein